MNVPLSAVGVAFYCVVALMTASASASAPCKPAAPRIAAAPSESQAPSWIFRPSTYTHDPQTGARVAQYMRTPPVEPLEDERAVTSRYRRSRTNLRGTDGSFDTYYEVQAWGNGRGGIDAEWERFHDAWKESYLQGGFYNQTPSWGGPWRRPSPWNHGGAWHHGWQGHPGNGFPGGWSGWGGGQWPGDWSQGGNNFPPNEFGPGGP